MTFFIELVLLIALPIIAIGELSNDTAGTVVVTTCCEQPLNDASNTTWCQGMYSQNENIEFRYGTLPCNNKVNVDFSGAGSVWEGGEDGFFPDYFLKYDGNFYSPQDYCLRSLNEDNIEVSICKPDCTGDALCIPKCCNLWDDVSFKNNTIFCVPSLEEKIWEPIIHDNADYRKRMQLPTSNLHFYVHDPSTHPDSISTKQCTTFRLVKYQHFDFKILKNGQVAWTSSDVLDWYRIPEGRFCVDREFAEGTAEDASSGTSVLVGCLEDFIPKINDSLTMVDTINFVLVQISLMFLAFTLIIYVLLRRHQNIHSWTQFSYFFALWSNLLLAAIIYYQTYEDFNLQIANEGAGHSRGALCFTTCKKCMCLSYQSLIQTISAIMSTFLYNATLTTMVVLALDVFKMIQQLLCSVEQKTTKLDFVKKQLFAWGVAALLTITGLCLYISNGSMNAPPYGYANCKAKFWLADEIFGSFCHLTTLTLFFITAFRIGTMRLKKKEEIKEINEQRNFNRAYALRKLYTLSMKELLKIVFSVCLFFKLFVVMGMTWISILMDQILVRSTTDVVKWLLTLMEFASDLQGFVIFFLFAFNRKTLDYLGENYSIIRKLSNASSIGIDEHKTELPGSPPTVKSNHGTKP